MAQQSRELRELVTEARKRGAARAKLIPASYIVVDERVRLKCSVPLCDNYGRHLLCPPNVMPIEQFRIAVGGYRRALLLQVESSSDSADKSSKHLDADLARAIGNDPGTKAYEKKLAQLVEDIEALAFKRGFTLAAGFGGSDCALCEACVGQASGKPCRHPFRARPSMQAMGIDVAKTCARAGMPIRFSSSDKVRLTGLVLLD